MKRPLVICGPSGVGKGTLIQTLLKEHSQFFGFSVSHTTRAPRPGEVDGTHYFFVNKEDMQKEIEKGAFIEYAKVNINLYGTSFKAVESVLSKGLCCILDIDVQGVKQIKTNSNLNPYVIFIAPPSVEVLEQRLRGRKTESEEAIQKRLECAKNELDALEKDKDHKLFDYTLVNDDLMKAAEELKKVVKQNVVPEMKI